MPKILVLLCLMLFIISYRSNHKNSTCMMKFIFVRKTQEKRRQNLYWGQLIVNESCSSYGGCTACSTLDLEEAD